MTNSLMNKGTETLVQEMKNLAAQWEQGISTWENTCGYDINEELLPFLSLPSEGEYV